VPQGSTVAGAALRQKFPPKPPSEYRADITIGITQQWLSAKSENFPHELKFNDDLFFKGADPSPKTVDPEKLLKIFIGILPAYFSEIFA
jgi:hypothetical protein